MAAQYQLVMHAGPTPGKVYPLEGDVLTIGREAGNAVTINDAEISRKHTQMVSQGGKYVLTDLGSTNGTFVNGQRITGQHVLQPGDSISLGEQINLVYEAVVAVDPNATMISPAAANPAPAPRAKAAAPPRPAAPAQSSADYVGQVPASPAGYVAPAAPAKKGLPMPAIIAGVVLLCAVCSCIGFFAYVDSNSLWCDFMPFLFAGACA